MRRVLFAVVLIAAGACAVQEDGAPRLLPDEQSIGFGELATGEEAEGGGRVYLLTPAGAEEQIQLRSVPRNDAASPRALLESLLRGPNEDEITGGLSTAIPADLEILSARTVGTRLTINVNDAFNELSDDGLRQALAQLIATASEIDQVQQIRLRVNGENQLWPTGDGEVTDQTLSIYDFPGFLETSQPAYPTVPAQSLSEEV